VVAVAEAGIVVVEDVAVFGDVVRREAALESAKHEALVERTKIPQVAEVVDEEVVDHTELLVAETASLRPSTGAAVERIQ